MSRSGEQNPEHPDISDDEGRNEEESVLQELTFNKEEAECAPLPENDDDAEN
ncbi:unnamed protein product [Brugia pahangi]|uniref:CTNNB1_binding domain-containing protein n=1 Tax=Brugia pahangi TaxID=6280 RepID=A0A0N4T2Y3_BRUPA|nr:unnamed protein product [Brugia pahangi]